MKNRHHTTRTRECHGKKWENYYGKMGSVQCTTVTARWFVCVNKELMNSNRYRVCLKGGRKQPRRSIYNTTNIDIAHILKVDTILKIESQAHMFVIESIQ